MALASSETAGRRASSRGVAAMPKVKASMNPDSPRTVLTIDPTMTSFSAMRWCAPAPGPIAALKAIPDSSSEAPKKAQSGRKSNGLEFMSFPTEEPRN